MRVLALVLATVALTSAASVKSPLRKHSSSYKELSIYGVPDRVSDASLIAGHRSSSDELNSYTNAENIAYAAAPADYAYRVGTGGYAIPTGAGSYAVPAGTGSYAIPAGAGSYAVPAGAGSYAVPAGTGSYAIPAGAGSYAVPAGASSYAIPAGAGSYAIPASSALSPSGHPYAAGVVPNRPLVHTGVNAFAPHIHPSEGVITPLTPLVPTAGGLAAPASVYPAFPTLVKAGNRLSTSPYSSEILTSSVAGNTGTNAISNEPLVVFTKTADKKEMKGCLVIDGLASFADNSCTKSLHKAIIAGEKKKALYFDPSTFDVDTLYTAKNLPVTKFEVPEDLNMADLARLAAPSMPWLLVLDKDDFNKVARNWEFLPKIAEVELSEDSAYVRSNDIPSSIERGYLASMDNDSEDSSSEGWTKDKDDRDTTGENKRRE